MVDKPSILIIDGSPQARPLLEEALAGYGPLWADPDEGPVLVREQTPDLVLIGAGEDPGLSSAICREIKGSAGRDYLPLIIVSAGADPGARLRGLEAGAVDFIGPPLDPAEIAARVGSQLEIRRLNLRLRRNGRRLAGALARIRRQNNRLRLELEAAAEVQRALLPEVGPGIPNLTLEWRLEPSSSVAGDVLDWYVLDDSRVGFYLADVSGHGAASGLLAASLHQALTPRPDRSSLVRTLEEGGGGWRPTPPEEVARELERIFPYGRFEKYFTLFYGVLNHRTGRLDYLTAGHPRPILLRGRGGLHELETTGPPVGLEAGEFDPAGLFLEPGDRLLIYSDGVTEAENGEGFFGRERLLAALEEQRGRSLGGFLDSLLARLEEFRGRARRTDDVACLGLEMGREQLTLF